MKHKITSFVNDESVTVDGSKTIALVLTADRLWGKGTTAVEAVAQVLGSGTKKTSKAILYLVNGAEWDEVYPDQYGGAYYPQAAIVTKLFLNKVGAVVEEL